MFNKLNEEMNYYCEISKKNGENCWAQDKIQSSFINMISSCNLTKEQLEKLGNLMVGNNASIDMEASNNMSVDKFKEFAKNRLSELGKSKTMS